MTPHLYLGNRNYSSWSLRAWLAVKWSGLPFTETFIDLDQPGYGEGGIAEVLAVSPTGRVPVLVAGGVAIWDSLAIAEWAAEQAAARPGAPPLWPVDPLLRAQARSVAAEMHSGFTGMRRDLSMNIRRRCAATGLPRETLADVARIDAMWSGLRRAHAARGPWLFGERSIADAFYLPVATRFRTYGIALSHGAQAYAQVLLAEPAFREWEAALLAQPARKFTRAGFDDLYAGTP
jgi:glutathione S-transferase